MSHTRISSAVTRILLSTALTSLPVALAACSGANFEGASPDADVSAEASAPSTATTPPSSGDAGASEASAHDAAPAEAATLEDASESDAASIDAGDSGDAHEDAPTSRDAGADADASDAADAATDAPEACTKNACGGCTKLTGAPGDACLSCGGKLVCDGADALKCEGAAPKNACGGCSTLTHASGSACGVCGSGKYVCDGVDATKCSDPVTTPAPGTKCGTCGTLAYACNGSGTATVCSGDDANACGGCTALAHAPGSSCGACGSGHYVCAGKESTTCSDPVTTAVGTVCGICGTSKFACTAAGTTACVKSDDRSAGGDTLESSADSIFTLADEQPVAYAFATQRIGAITGVQLAVNRFSKASGSPPGTLTVRLIKGVPTYYPLFSDVLATASVSGDVVGAAMSPVSFTFPTPTAVLPAGTKLWIEITASSASYNFEIGGGAASTPEKVSFWYLSSGSYAKFASNDPYLAVLTDGCF